MQLPSLIHPKQKQIQVPENLGATEPLGPCQPIGAWKAAIYSCETAGYPYQFGILELTLFFFLFFFFWGGGSFQ